MNAWETILLAIGGNAALLALLGWLARSLLGQLVAKDLERFKSELASASSTAADQLRHQLQLVAQEHQIVVAKLHEKRAQVVAEAYGLLVEAQWAGQEFVSPMEFAGEPSKREKYHTAMNKSAEFYRYFDKNRIYLPANLCQQIDELLQAMRSKVIGFGIYAHREDSELPEQTLTKKHESWSEASEHFNSAVPKARKALEEELRKIIGSEAKDKN
ncbi:MAG: hypothetical protein QMB55_01335 [Propionivibrio sp.]